MSTSSGALPDGARPRARTATLARDPFSSQRPRDSNAIPEPTRDRGRPRKSAPPRFRLRTSRGSSHASASPAMSCRSARTPRRARRYGSRGPLSALLSDHPGAADGRDAASEGRQETVAGGLDQCFSWRVDLSPRKLVVRLDQLAPALVADRDDSLGRGDDVAETNTGVPTVVAGRATRQVAEEGSRSRLRWRRRLPRTAGGRRPRVDGLGRARAWRCTGRVRSARSRPAVQYKHRDVDRRQDRADVHPPRTRRKSREAAPAQSHTLKQAERAAVADHPGELGANSSSPRPSPQ